MFSGKSLELICRAKSARDDGLTVCAAVAVVGREARHHIVSHAGTRLAATSVSDPIELFSVARGHDVVLIDEAQFLDREVIDVVDALVCKGARVVVAGLDLDFRGEPFGFMAELMRLADRVDHLTAVCSRCGARATLTQRLREGVPVPLADPVIDLGSEGYEPRCERCFHEERSISAPPR